MVNPQKMVLFCVVLVSALGVDTQSEAKAGHRDTSSHSSAQIAYPPDTAAVCTRLTAFSMHTPGVARWYSDAAMPALGTIECTGIFPLALNAVARPWIDALLDNFSKPGGPATQGESPTYEWRPWCDHDGVPPVLYAAANRRSASDNSVVEAFATTLLRGTTTHRLFGIQQLPSGAMARNTSGKWQTPTLPVGNTSQITWPDDCFMCTSLLSHAAVMFHRTDFVDTAATRLLGVYNSGQRDPEDALVWHGFDAWTGNHSCCKWGDGNGWLVMGMADALTAYHSLNATSSQSYKALHTAFVMFVQGWLRTQGPSGLWYQLLDDATTYPCTSGTAFVLYALASALRVGYLPINTTLSPLMAAWDALAASVGADGSVANLSPGFGILGTRAQYMVRNNASLLWGYGAVVRAAAAVGALETKLCAGWNITRGYVYHGFDIGAFPVPGANDTSSPLDGMGRCARACCRIEGCYAWTTGPADGHGGKCTFGKPCCYLKTRAAVTSPRFKLDDPMAACGITPSL